MGEYDRNIDAGKIWNNAPLSIKECKTLYNAKIEIKKICEFATTIRFKPVIAIKALLNARNNLKNY